MELIALICMAISMLQQETKLDFQMQKPVYRMNPVPNK